MTDTIWPQIYAYASIAVFIIFTAALYRKYSNMPTHLRWELYPVPHERSRPYGGSFFEETDWWTKPREKSKIGELMYMGREILGFREYWERNRGYWYFVYPFHIGLYLMLGWLAFTVLGAIASEVADKPVDESSHVLANIVYYATLVIGIGAFVVGTWSTIALIIKRLTDDSLRRFTAPIDYLHLIFLQIIFTSGLCSWAIFDRTFADSTAFIHSLITANEATKMNVPLGIFIICGFLFLAYIPFTGMMHFLAKHFTFTQVLWDDEPNVRGSLLERKLEFLLDHEVSWSGPHIQAGSTWCKIVTKMPENPEEAEAE